MKIKTILLIEDDELVRESILDVLMITGHKVEVAENGEEGLALINKALPDLVISDVMMPKMDGFELLKRLNEEQIKVPFMFLSAKSREVDMLNGLKLGANDYIIKPFANEELIAKIESLL